MRHVPHKTILAGLILIVGCAALVRVTNYNLGAVLSVSALLAAVPMSLAFGLSSVLQGIVAGAVIRSERKFRVGQWMTIVGFSGQVAEINLRTTQLTAEDGSRVEVPNATILQSAYIVRNTPPPTEPESDHAPHPFTAQSVTKEKP